MYSSPPHENILTAANNTIFNNYIIFSSLIYNALKNSVEVLFLLWPLLCSIRVAQLKSAGFKEKKRGYKVHHEKKKYKKNEITNTNLPPHADLDGYGPSDHNPDHPVRVPDLIERFRSKHKICDTLGIRIQSFPARSTARESPQETKSEPSLNFGRFGLKKNRLLLSAYNSRYQPMPAGLRVDPMPIVPTFVRWAKTPSNLLYDRVFILQFSCAQIWNRI